MRGLINGRGNIYAITETRARRKTRPAAVDFYGFSHDATLSWVMDGAAGKFDRGLVRRDVARKWMQRVSSAIYRVHKTGELDPEITGEHYLKRVLYTALKESSLTQADLNGMEYFGRHPFASVAMSYERPDGTFEVLSLGSCGAVPVAAYGSDTAFCQGIPQLESFYQEFRESSHDKVTFLKIFERYREAVEEGLNQDGGFVLACEKADTALEASTTTFDTNSLLLATDGAFGAGISPTQALTLYHVAENRDENVREYTEKSGHDYTVLLHSHGDVPVFVPEDEPNIETENDRPQQLGFALFDDDVANF